MLRETKENVQGTKSDGKETGTQINGVDQKEETMNRKRNPSLVGVAPLLRLTIVPQQVMASSSEKPADAEWWVHGEGRDCRGVGSGLYHWGALVC